VISSLAARPAFRAVLVLVFAVAVVVLLATTEIRGTSPGLPAMGVILIAVSLAIGVVWAALRDPVLAVQLLLLATFLRLATQWNLPVALTTIAQLLVVGATALALWARRAHLPRFGLIDLLFFLYFAWAVGSALAPHELPAGSVASTDTGAFSPGRFVIASIVVPFALFVLGRTILDKEQAIRRVMWALVALAGYSSFVSIMQFNGPPALVWPKYILTSLFDDRAPGVFNQPNENGITIIIGFLLAIHLIRQPDTARWAKWVGGLFAVSAPYAVYLTHTRVIWLAFAVILVLGALMARGVRVWFVATLVVASLAILVNWSSFTSSDRTAGGVGESSQIEERLNGIATSLAAVQAKPFTGWGVGRFPAVNTLHHKQFSQDVRWAQGFGIVSHQNELGIATELGLPGLAIWLSIIVLLFRRIFAAIRILPAGGLVSRGLAVAIFLSFLTWVLSGIADDLRYFDYENATVIMLVGILIGATTRYVQRTQEQADADRVLEAAR
jgi:hypothetical protein